MCKTVRLKCVLTSFSQAVDDSLSIHAVNFLDNLSS